MAILTTGASNGDVFLAGTAGTTSGLNAIADRINTHTHEGSDTAVISNASRDFVLLTSGVISSLGSGLRFSGTNFLNPGSYVAYRLLGTVNLSGNGVAITEVGIMINQVSGTSYEFCRLASGTTFESITGANAFLLSRMQGGTDYFMDVTVQAGSSTAPGTTNPIIGLNNDGSWQAAADVRAIGIKGALTGQTAPTHTIDIVDTNGDPWGGGATFSGTTSIYLYGIRRNR